MEVAITLWLLIGLIMLTLYEVTGFKCQSCTYSWTRAHPDDDTACVYQPDVFTGWRVLPCENYCVVQETYNTGMQKVVGYWRSCSDKPTSGVCTGEEIQTCLYTCQGDYCNSWVRGQLHDLYGSSTNATSRLRSGVVTLSSSFLIGWLIMKKIMIFMIDR